VRGFDARNGQAAVDFPHDSAKGEPGYETWLDGSAEYTGNAGVWARMSADTELGLVYLPVEAPIGDVYGGHRPGSNLYGNSLVCLDAKTGQKVWHYQLIHHDIWDWDNPTAPVLMDLVVDGKTVKAVAQITKQGWVYTFDRTNGTPGVADRGASGSEGRRAGRVVFADPAVPEQAARVRPARRHRKRSHRLHARAAR